MGRSPCCDKLGLKKGPWTPEEDQKLMAFIDQHGHGSWRALPAKAGLQRCGKSCRLRWTNYLRPDIKRGKFSLQDEQTIIQLHALLGNRWSAIATHLPKRTDNEIKNYWNTHLKKRLAKMGIDPVTHKPCSGTLCATAGLSHMAQWESARLEAEARLETEARLFRESKLLSSSNNTACLDVLKAWQAQLTSLYHHEESPASTLSMPVGGATNFPAMVDVDTMTNINIPILPLSYCNDTGNAWFSSNEVAGDGFPEYLVCGINGTNDVVESYGTGHHGTGFVGEDNKNYWNNKATLSCSFGYGDHEQGNVIGGGQYGANFEDNNIITAYWDNIMNMVENNRK